MTEQFDPIEALAAEGIPVPQEITPENVAELAPAAVADAKRVLLRMSDGAGHEATFHADRTWSGDAAYIEHIRNYGLTLSADDGEGNSRPDVAAKLATMIEGSGTKVDVVGADRTLTGVVKGINPKDKLGLAKVDMSVVPPAALLHLASAMMDGVAKYGPFNWRDNAVLGRVYVAAAMRHLMQYLDGEDIDPTSGVHHLGHAMACAAIILDARETGNLDDNRPKAGAAGAMIRRWTPDTKLG